MRQEFLWLTFAKQYKLSGHAVHVVQGHLCVVQLRLSATDAHDDAHPVVSMVDFCSNDFVRNCIGRAAKTLNIYELIVFRVQCKIKVYDTQA